MPILTLIHILKGAAEFKVDVQRRLNSFTSVSEELGILLVAGKMGEKFGTVSP